MKVKQILLYSFIFFLPSQLGKHFFLPFSIVNGVRIDYLAPTLYLTDILFLAIIIFYWKELRILFQRKIYIFFSLLILTSFFALLPWIAFYKLLKVAEIVLLFIIVQKANLNYRYLLIIFSASAIIQLILSSFHVFSGKSIQGIFYFFGERYFTISTPAIAKVVLQGKEILRGYGSFSHPNSLAGYYLLLYTFILYEKKFNKYSIIKYIFLGISSILIFLSFSKIVIALFLGVTGYFLIQNISCRLCVSARILGLTILSIIFISAHGDPESISKRTLLIWNSLQILSEHPFLGVGLGNYVIAQSKYPITYSYHFLQPVHNIFLLLLTEIGVPIFIYISYFIISFVSKLLKKKRYVMIPVLCVILVTGMVDHYWLTLQQNLLLLPVVFGLLQNHKLQ